MKEKNTELSNTLIKGRLTELKCLTYFLEREYIVSTPEIPCPYDFILDTGNQLLKIQVKTCHLSSEQDYLEFNTSSLTHNAKGYTKRTYSSESVDYFCTYFDNQCYLIPLAECGSKAKRLRLVPTKNGQEKNITFAKNYIAEEVLKTL